MSGKTFSFLLLLLVSLGLGVGIGEWYFKLFLRAVPPVALSQFNSQAAHVVYWMYGAAVGVALFVWSLIGIAVNKLTSIGSRDTTDQ